MEGDRHIHTDMVEITTAEYIQIIAAGIYATALFYTIVTFRRSKRIDQITLGEHIFSDLRELDRELAKIPPESQYDNARSIVYYRIFNNLDYLSFNVNRKIIDDKKLIEYMKPYIIKYYEETFQTHASTADKSDPNSYREFKRFYFKLKK
ncbi:MAG: hypothetical protein M3288_06990 [Thermoproteota archaeon]|nr:hypothetical protein [Thermoproteota archaeon]